MIYTTIVLCTKENLPVNLRWLLCRNFDLGYRLQRSRSWWCYWYSYSPSHALLTCTIIRDPFSSTTTPWYQLLWCLFQYVNDSLGPNWRVTDSWFTDFCSCGHFSHLAVWRGLLKEWTLIDDVPTAPCRERYIVIVCQGVNDQTQDTTGLVT